MSRKRPQVTTDSKFCNPCKTFKKFEDFYKTKRTFDGLHNRCKSCHVESTNKWRSTTKDIRKAQAKKWQTENVEKRRNARNIWSAKNRDKIRNYGLQRKYKITLQDYEVMLESQGRKCLGCELTLEQLQDTLHVDHSHSTGKVRGLLCANCNKVLGLVYDKTETLKRLETYLKEKRNEL